VSGRAGIIAAGRGERLRGAAQPLKPLVRVGGQTLVERVLTSIGETEPSEVVIIINEESTEVRDHVESRTWPFDLRWIVETTPSSMHSFLRVVETLAEAGDSGPFLVSTVDTVAPPGAYARFIAEARRRDAAITLALTRPASDDAPLRVRVDARDGRSVTAIGDLAGDSGEVTAGYYAVRPTILKAAEQARRDGLSALRQFLARLLADGYRLDAIHSPASIDVDSPPDVDVAEHFLRGVSL
jgi:NDP-sugar pyrophosphorylase family protein